MWGLGKEGMFQGVRNDLHHMLLISKKRAEMSIFLSSFGWGSLANLQAVLLEQ